ncbi:uncharacterized protein KY384_006191 [Bacidia gigantensis]|uniref:uncharacterized protein n=1 Tax=Bacidia gigantensis TaxID=2732470 RepID=UPI001D03D2D8|nr:uncharacterized protein KY384_006191 [Bacidia gigantensis]KAG8529554.1 hypothetical protein KY384_006191 [Bacidia gigantensis]
MIYHHHRRQKQRLLQSYPDHATDHHTFEFTSHVKTDHSASEADEDLKAAAELSTIKNRAPDAYLSSDFADAKSANSIRKASPLPFPLPFEGPPKHETSKVVEIDTLGEIHGTQELVGDGAAVHEMTTAARTPTSACYPPTIGGSTIVQSPSTSTDAWSPKSQASVMNTCACCGKRGTESPLPPLPPPSPRSPSASPSRHEHREGLAAMSEAKGVGKSERRGNSWAGTTTTPTTEGKGAGSLERGLSCATEVSGVGEVVRLKASESVLNKEGRSIKMTASDRNDGIRSGWGEYEGKQRDKEVVLRSIILAGEKDVVSPLSS